jgi:hypothetical protein
MIHASTVTAMAFLQVILFFVGIPAIAGVIAYAASKGLPENFSREMYWTAFVSACVAAALLFVGAQRFDLEGLWHVLAHYVCAILSLLAFGIAMGCGVAIFTHRGRAFSQLGSK